MRDVRSGGGLESTREAADEGADVLHLPQRPTSVTCPSPLRIVQRNGLADNRWFFQPDAPCWLCRGGKTLGCPDCGGSGMRSRSGFVAD